MKTAASQPGPRYEALLQVLKTAERLWEASRLFLSRWELSPSQFNVLNLLHVHPEGLSQTDLSRALIMHRSNLTGLVDRLEGRGLVARQENPEDRRAWYVGLTGRGAEIVKEILPEYYLLGEKVWGELSTTRAREIAIDLEALGQRASQLINPK